jgi:hypothetical protein
MSPEDRMATAILALEDEPWLKHQRYARFKGLPAFREAVIAAKVYLNERDDAAGHPEPDGRRGARGAHQGLLGGSRLRRED